MKLIQASIAINNAPVGTLHLRTSSVNGTFSGAATRSAIHPRMIAIALTAPNAMSNELPRRTNRGHGENVGAMDEENFQIQVTEPETPTRAITATAPRTPSRGIAACNAGTFSEKTRATTNVINTANT
jgi:hypothetical protein